MPIGGAMSSEDENDLFSIPEVKLSGKTKKKKSEAKKHTKKAKAGAKNEDSEDLLSFISSKPDRQSGVGGEKVESYHDDDDVDMLDA